VETVIESIVLSLIFSPESRVNSPESTTKTKNKNYEQREKLVRVYFQSESRGSWVNFQSIVYSPEPWVNLGTGYWVLGKYKLRLQLHTTTNRETSSDSIQVPGTGY